MKAPGRAFPYVNRPAESAIVLPWVLAFTVAFGIVDVLRLVYELDYV